MEVSKLNYLTLQEAKEGLEKKYFSSFELTKSCLKRIHALEKSTQKSLNLNAFIPGSSNHALKEAKLADDQRKNGASTKPILGIPIAVKDNYCIQGLRTTASSKLLDNFIPPYTATVWTRIKEAGGILLGKTNMDAWAHGSSTETSDYGTTKNPWNTSKLPGGSSGGSAAAVAANECIAALGTETAGSIRQPAAWCGVVGLKPTYGRTSRYGIISMGSSLDCPGPITKTVSDAAILLEIIAGKDSLDGTTTNIPIAKYTKFLGKSIKNVKIGVCDEYFGGVEKSIVNSVQVALAKLENLGALLIPIKLFNPYYAIAVYTVLQRSEVSSNLARYDGIRFGFGREKFGDEAKRRIMLGTFTLSAGYHDEYYLKAEKVRTLIINDFHEAFKKVDVIIGPTSPSLPLPLGSSKNHPMFGELADILVEPSSIAGLPGLNVPCGFAHGLPIGMQIIGPQFNEDLLLQVGYAYEQVTNWYNQKPNL